ncbi:ead/Ea22-like family protein [Salmonella enterica]|nr:ead/Ea22-like family protein [Salmonella enterica]EBW7254734.1 ead/Ea22-like family protein [Salmonella enterica subsp. enterica serovar Gatow]EKS2390032.1 ead/Ea22-like family protein [Salmonella enterica]ELO0592897.1 ead/Ea22-like family protein [Salmonella enterica]HCM6305223.1 ead/Ea22-like family protein [Salmonella enterica subsp. enterica serovar 6,14:y:1,7]
MTIDKQALREAAEKVNSGEWSYEEFNRMDLPGGAHININGRDAIYCLKKPVGGVEQSRAVTAFIAAFNPKVALALLDEVEFAEHTSAVDHEAACSLVEENETLKRRIAEQREYYEGVIADGSKRIAELERSETQLISERDDAESALNDAYKAVMGQPPEWSNWFSFENAIDEIELACELWRNQTDDVIQFRRRIAELEAREVILPDRKSEIFWPGDAAEFDILGYVIAVKSAIRAAGIKVKG